MIRRGIDLLEFSFFGVYRATLPEIRIPSGAQMSATLLETWA
jgi:hypothetical protein